MRKVLYCREVGMDCDLVTHTDIEEEIVQQTAAHTQSAHSRQELSPEIPAVVPPYAIRDIPARNALKKMSGATAGRHVAMMALQDVAYARKSTRRKKMQYRQALVWTLMLLLPLTAWAQNLATVKVSAHLSAQPGRSIATVRGHHFVVDSPAPLGGPNEEINPLEVLLSALATCGVFVSETVAKEKSMPLHAVTAQVEGDLDPRGVRGAEVDPRLQAFRVTLHVTGPTQEQAEVLASAFQQRCPVYTTLVRSAPIELQVKRSHP